MYWTNHLKGGPRRVNHAAVAVGTSIFTFGGYDSDIDYLVFKPIDIHILDTEKLKWWKLELNKDQDPACIPFQRYGHTVVAFGTSIYLWGGRNDSQICNKLYCFNTETLTWSLPTVYGKKPVPRESHSACVIGNFMYIFGGCRDHPIEYAKDLYMINLHTKKWSLIKTKGNPPSFRDFHIAAAIDKKMYIFGGRGDVHAPLPSGKEIYCPKLYSFDTTNNTWVCPKIYGRKPKARRSHSAFVHNNFLYIFGGFNKNMNLHFNDLNRYDPVTSRWTLVTPKGMPPCARRRQICQMVDNKVFISGGTSPNPISVVRIRVIGMELEPILDTLVDHADVHVLDLNPNLKTMCLVNVWKYLKQRNILVHKLEIPLSLKKELAAFEPIDSYSDWSLPLVS